MSSDDARDAESSTVAGTAYTDASSSGPDNVEVSAEASDAAARTRDANKQTEDETKQQTDVDDASPVAAAASASASAAAVVVDADDDDAEDEDEAAFLRGESNVQLGYAEPVDWSELLTSRFFPSKAGGKPAWLNLRDVPAPEQLCCGVCETMMKFLVQVYAPLSEDTVGPADAGPGRSFHRMLYVFVCPHARCMAFPHKSVKVLRSQLPQENEFYASDPINEDDEIDRLEQQELENEECIDEDCDDDELLWKYKFAQQQLDTVHLCKVCGVRAPNKCSGCKQAFYCCRAHQLYDWKINGHRAQCSAAAAATDTIPPKPTKPGELFSAYCSRPLPELEIVTEREQPSAADDANKEKQNANSNNDSSSSSSASASKDDKVQELLRRYEESQQKLSAKEREAEHKEFASYDDTTSVYERFQNRIRHNPQQILRYEHNGQPLWIAAEPMPTHDQQAANKPTTQVVPPCEQCGSRRVFEFQIMPQLLYFLHVHDYCGLGDHEQASTSGSSDGNSRSDGAQKYQHAGAREPIDFGCIAVYTCPKSCGDGRQRYFTEAAFCQYSPH